MTTTLPVAPRLPLKRVTKMENRKKTFNWGMYDLGGHRNLLTKAVSIAIAIAS